MILKGEWCIPNWCFSNMFCSRILSSGKAPAGSLCCQAGGWSPRVHIKRHTNLSAEAGEGQPFPGSLPCGGCVMSARWWPIMHRPCTSALVPLASFQTCTHLHFFIKSLPFSAERPGRLVLSSTPSQCQLWEEQGLAVWTEEFRELPLPSELWHQRRDWEHATSRLPLLQSLSLRQAFSTLAAGKGHCSQPEMTQRLSQMTQRLFAFPLCFCRRKRKTQLRTPDAQTGSDPSPPSSPAWCVWQSGSNMNKSRPFHFPCPDQAGDISTYSAMPGPPAWSPQQWDAFFLEIEIGEKENKEGGGGFCKSLSFLPCLEIRGNYGFHQIRGGAAESPAHRFLSLTVSSGAFLLADGRGGHQQVSWYVWGKTRIFRN